MIEDPANDTIRIYHICRRVDWDGAAINGYYHAPDSDRADGFLHFSNGAQIIESAARHRAGQSGLVLIEADCAKLGQNSATELRWETSRNGSLFPHLYGPIPLDAVTAVNDLSLGPDGLHVFPKLD